MAVINVNDLLRQALAKYMDQTATSDSVVSRLQALENQNDEIIILLDSIKTNTTPVP